MTRSATTTTKKSEQTRARILEAALALFRKRGFEKTTMRDIAQESGVALGAAYYYFDSKDALVMGFYERAQQDLGPLLEEALAKTHGLEERLRAAIEVKFQYFAPNRQLLGALSAHIDPQHPLSPFSEETRAIRERDTRFLAAAVDAQRGHDVGGQQLLVQGREVLARLEEGGNAAGVHRGGISVKDLPTFGLQTRDQERAFAQ